MTAKIFKRRTIRTGAVRKRDLGYLLVGDTKREENEESHTFVLQWKPDGWKEQEHFWTARSACVASLPKEHLVAIGQAGDFLVVGGGDNEEGNIFPKDESREGTGTMTGVYEVAGKAYAVGMEGFVYRRDGTVQWTRVDYGIREDADLKAIHGFSENDIYAVGWKGALWHFDGKTWTDKDSPTSVILSSVCCASDGKVYCCGQDGTLVVGRGDKWKVVAEGDTQQDLWDLEWFGGKLYISTMLFLYTLEGSNLAPVQFDDPPSSCYHLSSRDGVMWSIGADDVMVFDGSSWTRLR